MRERATEGFGSARKAALGKRASGGGIRSFSRAIAGLTAVRLAPALLRFSRLSFRRAGRLLNVARNRFVSLSDRTTDRPRLAYHSRVGGHENGDPADQCDELICPCQLKCPHQIDKRARRTSSDLWSSAPIRKFWTAVFFVRRAHHTDEDRWRRLSSVGRSIEILESAVPVRCLTHELYARTRRNSTHSKWRRRRSQYPGRRFGTAESSLLLPSPNF